MTTKNGICFIAFTVLVQQMSKTRFPRPLAYPSTNRFEAAIMEISKSSFDVPAFTVKHRRMVPTILVSRFDHFLIPISGIPSLLFVSIAITLLLP
jgi:hypothetical protein